MGDTDLNGILSFGTMCESDSMQQNSGSDQTSFSRIEDTRKRLAKQFSQATGLSSTVGDMDEDENLSA